MLTYFLIHTAGADNFYSPLSVDNTISDYEEASCYMAISQTKSGSHLDNEPISDDPVCRSIYECAADETEDIDRTYILRDKKGLQNDYEDASLVKMHKNSVYHKDLVVSPSTDTTKSGNAKKAKATTTNGSKTGDKTVSSGSDDSYEPVDPTTQKNSVMIYDDVMAPKDNEKTAAGQKVIFFHTVFHLANHTLWLKANRIPSHGQLNLTFIIFC